MLYKIKTNIEENSSFHPNLLFATQLVLINNSINYSALNNAVIASAENASQQNDKTNSFRVCPNPAKEVLFVETKGNASFSLIDQSGKILVAKNINGKGGIDISGMSAGLYYPKITRPA